MKEDAYTSSLKKVYGSVMTAFPDLSHDEIDAIVEYINTVEKIQYNMPVALQ